MMRDELQVYRESVRSFLAGASPDGLWKRLAGELGAVGLLIPESNGGAGADLAVALPMLGEIAASTAALPYLTGAVLAPSALLACPDSERRSHYLAAIAGGGLLATVATPDIAPGTRTVEARGAGGQWKLSGIVDIVLEAESADVMFVVAETDSGSAALFAVAADAVTRQPLKTLDLTRPAARVEFDSIGAELLAEDFDEGRRHLFDIACAALSVEMAEAGAAALAMAVEYAKIRSQFGTLIGAQQLVQKLCADMFVTVASARAIASAASAAIAAGSADSGRLAAVAKAYASERAPGVGESNIQVHGGIGYTWEHPAHIYLRRIRSAAQLFGDAKFHRRALAGRLELARSR